MAEDSTYNGSAAAQTMLDAFASVGATHFHVTWTTLAGEKEKFRRSVSHVELCRTIGGILVAAAVQQNSITIRPVANNVTFIQLDDLDSEKLARVAPAVFLITETSPANFQAWAALAEGTDKDFARRLKKGVGADPFASGAGRIAGSFNFKEEYVPEFPRVRIHASIPGQYTSIAELERLEVVAAPEPAAQTPRITSAPSSSAPSKWPDYQRCLDRAPLSQSQPGKNRQSIADFTWCMIAASWGWQPHEISSQLMQISAKAKENGEVYARKTAIRASEAAARNIRQSRKS